jgi:DnaJ homolog subfamily C member 3
MSNQKKAEPYCKETLELRPESIPALLSKAQGQLDEDGFEEAINTLNAAKEFPGGGQNAKLNELLQKAHVLLKRSKQKDYYKTLGVTRDADDRTIKRAYRQLTKQHHPDKAHAQGLSKDAAEKKMAIINEAYEVLSDAELRQRFDNGDDPNSQEGQQRGQGGHPFHGSHFGQQQGGQQQFFFQQGGFKFPGGGGGSFQFPG